MKISDKFPRYTAYEPLVPVWCVTPEGGGLHRFFDTDPISPSGRYLAVLRFPQEERPPRPGESAQIVLIDLEQAAESVVADTCGWEPQMGANIQWGASDHTLYFNDVDLGTWEPYCVQLDPFTKARRKLDATVYHISPDGKHIISACMKRMRRTQYGYGVLVPDEYVPHNHGFVEDDGIYITSTETGARRLLVSIKDAFDQAVPAIDKSLYRDGQCYGFHCKYNPQGDKIMFSMRWFKTDKPEPWDMLQEGCVKFFVFTMNTDGSGIKLAVGPEQWDKHGHHTNWYPDGRTLSMNICIDGDGKLYLVKADYDGSNYGKIIDCLPGSGHPTVHADGRHILTDAYKEEPVAFGDGTVPLRWIDLHTRDEKSAVRINVSAPAVDAYTFMRVDPHPAWHKDWRHVIFNGYADGARRVYIADFGELL